MRGLRNRIVHSGFGLGDGKLSAGLLLGEAIPVLAIAYNGFFQLDLYEALSVDLGQQLRIAVNVYSRIRLDPATDGRQCCGVLAHAIRWGIRGSLISDWEAKATEDADYEDLRFAMVDRQKDKLERAFGASWSFECPICGDPSLVAELVSSQLDLGKIVLSRAVCADCGLVISDVSSLADTVCAKEIEETRSEILQEYGIE
jgi:hypothetical protein